MDKLAMLSVLFATAAIPVAFARDADPRRGVKRMIVALVVFYCFYAGYVGWIHTTYFVPKPWIWSK